MEELRGMMTIGKNKQVQFVIIQKDSSLKYAATAAAAA